MLCDNFSSLCVRQWCFLRQLVRSKHCKSSFIANRWSNAHAVGAIDRGEGRKERVERGRTEKRTDSMWRDATRRDGAALFKRRKTEMGSAVNIESNGGAIGTKRSGMTLLLESSALCNCLGLLPQSADSPISRNLIFINTGWVVSIFRSDN